MTTAVTVVNSATPSTVDQAKAIVIANGINGNGTSIIEFGAQAQLKISEFADTILREVRAKDAGEIGTVLTTLMQKCKGVDATALTDMGGFIAKLPLIGGLFNRAKNFIDKYEKVGEEIELISSKLNEAKATILKDIEILEGLYASNIQSFQNLELYIAAGQLKLAELQSVTLPNAKANAITSDNQEVTEEYNQLEALYDRLDKKVHDLELSRMIALQAAPQIRLIQSNNACLAEKIQSSVLNTIPLWKNSLVIAITLVRQKKVMELQQAVSDTTNNLLRMNAELLKQGSIGIAKEAERGVVDITTLQEVNTKLISAIDEIQKIHADGRIARQAASKELEKIQLELKTKLVH
jgi:uncharacterized protein YaaN involved in tellurite resistance